MSSRALLLLAEGAEEMEVAIIADVMRRAGIEVTVAGIDGAEAVRCSRHLKIVPDVAIEAVGTLHDSLAPFDVIVLPGGAQGAKRLCASLNVGQLLREQEAQGRLLAAICAAPSALKAHKICAGRRMTIYPGMEDEIAGHGQLVKDRVVEDGNLITSQGPGTAFEFSLAIVARLEGDAKAAQVRKPLLLAGDPWSGDARRGNS